MCLSRQHYTLLAELIGNVEAGCVNAENIRSYVVRSWALLEMPGFNPEKFHRHADMQAELCRDVGD